MPFELEKELAQSLRESEFGIASWSMVLVQPQQVLFSVQTAEATIRAAWTIAGAAAICSNKHPARQAMCI
ncbi:hypothetical protein HDV03_005281 [Kappamyces sp. JEL0829]|nr:hypothetical protein HDV03_005281 [Kappamyces sp. JEL0829]